MKWRFGILFVVAGVILWLKRYLGRTPIGLSSVQTSGTVDGCEILVAVTRRDWLVGLEHGSSPQLERAWLSDGDGNELATSFQAALTPVVVAPNDGVGGHQWGWRFSPTLPSPSARVVFHATFVAKGAAPFTFEQDLRAGVDFNAPTQP